MASFSLGFFAALKCCVALDVAQLNISLTFPNYKLLPCMKERTPLQSGVSMMDAALSDVSLKVKSSKIGGGGGGGNDKILVFEQGNI